MIQEPSFITRDRQLILDTFKDLVFVEEGHKYYRNGQLLPSVSEVTHKFKPEFDVEKTAKKYSEKHGRTPEYWMDQWKFTNLKATTTGTLVHEYGEGMFWLRLGRPDKLPESVRTKYIQDKGWLIPTRPKEDAVLKFHKEMSQFDYPVLAETKVYNNFNPKAAPMRTSYCGTFDILYYRDNQIDPKSSGYIIKDYKTNRELYSDFSRSHGKMCLAPFGELPDEAFSMYTLQLSCYQIPLEDLGLNIVGREIIWLRDTGEYEVIPVPDVTIKLRNLL